MVPEFHFDNGPLFWFEERIFFNLKSPHFVVHKAEKKTTQTSSINNHIFLSTRSRILSTGGGCYVICNVFPYSLNELTHMKSSTEVAHVTVIRAEILHVFVCQL
jgi:hypothetical protein